MSWLPGKTLIFIYRKCSDCIIMYVNVHKLKAIAGISGNTGSPGPEFYNLKRKFSAHNCIL